MTEDEMVVWYHQLNGHEFKQAPGPSAHQPISAQSLSSFAQDTPSLGLCMAGSTWPSRVSVQIYFPSSEMLPQTI